MSNDEEYGGRETFAARWNRRKLEAKRAPQPQPVPAHPSAAARTGADAAVELPDERPLPSLDDISPDSTIAEFLEKRVPAELQKLALRKAWASDPVISSFIEVAENQYDWNAPDGVPGFGPMNPAWDVEKLLAHATGAGSAPEPESELADGSVTKECDIPPQEGAAPVRLQSTDEHVAAHNETHTETEPRVASQGPVGSEASQTHDSAPVSAPREIDMLEQTQRLAVHNNQAFVRRRHGGALP